MKQISKKIVLLLSIALTMTTSCSESLLDENLYGQLGESSLPKGAEGADQLVLGIYQKLQPNKYFTFSLYSQDVPSDQMFINWGGIPETAWGGMQNFLMIDANQAASINTWKTSYGIIAQCNEAIRIFEDEQETDEQVKEILAEAYFWRAYAYHRLVRVYGDAPLLKGGEDLSEGVGRTDRDEIIEFVISDLKRIENVLPSSRPSEDYGRVTKWAVKALLSNLYLNEKKWDDAKSYAKDIIDNGGFALMENYHDVFGVDGNKEVIVVSVAAGLHYRGNNFDAQSLDGNLNKALGIEGVSGSNGLGLAVSFFNTFDENDKRREDFDPVTKKGIMIHGYVNNQDGTPLYTDAEGTPLKVEESLNRVIALKYPLQENPTSGEWMTQDVAIYRLAEIYLTYAEALNELGDKAEALTFVNKIRNRAGLEDLSTSLSKDELRDAILDERGWELYTEGYRRDDLIRHGKLLEKVQTKWDYYFDKPWPMAGKEHVNLFPISSEALIKNPKLTQTPGF